MKLVLLFVFGFVTVLVMGDTKTGECPKVEEHLACEVTCEVDDTCPDTQKCCQNNCGTNSCVKPKEDAVAAAGEVFVIPKDWIQK